MLTYIYENKRILNLHEPKISKRAVFQANTILFQANTNASLKNPETQVRQLALVVHNQSRDSFLSDTKKNPNDCMAVTLRSRMELKSINEAEMKQTEAEMEKIDQNSTIRKKKLNINRLSDVIE